LHLDYVDKMFQTDSSLISLMKLVPVNLGF